MYTYRLYLVSGDFCSSHWLCLEALNDKDFHRNRPRLSNSMCLIICWRSKDVLLMLVREHLQTEARTDRNEYIWYPPLIFLPGFTVCFPTSRGVPYSSMYNHRNKESGIEPRERTFEACYQPPSDSKVDVTRIMDFPSHTICIHVSLTEDQRSNKTYTSHRQEGSCLPLSRWLWDSLILAMVAEEKSSVEHILLERNVWIDSSESYKYPKPNTPASNWWKAQSEKLCSSDIPLAHGLQDRWHNGNNSKELQLDSRTSAWIPASHSTYPFRSSAIM